MVRWRGAARSRGWQFAGAVVLAALLGVALPPAGVAAAAVQGGFVLVAASDDWDDWDDGWDDYNRTLLQLQRESIASQEEQARETGRAARREELEQDRRKEAEERAAYFDAILESSQASLRAPREVYYRKPGFTSADPPGPAAEAVDVGGQRYLYDQGIFWVQQGQDYVVVTAPVGATVAALPRGAIRVASQGAPHWYFFGTFFAEAGGAYAVVAPAPGLAVHYLPDGYTREKAGDAELYRFGETLFRPVFVQGILTYRVVSGK